MRRRGHGRPVGTTTARFRFRVLDGSGYVPRLGDLVVEAPTELERAYRIVGVEETRDPLRWGVYYERLAWDDSYPATADCWMQRDP